MKKLISITLSTLFCILVFSACDKKQHALENFTNFVEKVEKNAPEFTNEDWTIADKEYAELVAEVDKYEYSGDKAKRIAELKGKYAGIKAKNGIKKFFEDIDKAAQEVKGAIEGFTEGIVGNKESQEE